MYQCDAVRGDFAVKTSDFVSVHLTTSKSDTSFVERRFAKDLTIIQLKEKLELATGGSCATMKIEVYDTDNKLVCVLSNNVALLGSYPIDDGMRMHVVDTFSITNDFDTGNVEKLELTEEEYSKKNNTVRSFLLKNKLGKYNEENQKQKEKAEEEEREKVENIKVGCRCKVMVSNAPTRLGVVRYKGPLEGIAGLFIGVQYDEPLGKNDGSVKGVRYFECPDKYGAFVKPSAVTIGDFPVEDYDLNEEI